MMIRPYGVLPSWLWPFSPSYLLTFVVGLPSLRLWSVRKSLADLVT